MWSCCLGYINVCFRLKFVYACAELTYLASIGVMLETVSVLSVDGVWRLDGLVLVRGWILRVLHVVFCLLWVAFGRL